MSLYIEGYQEAADKLVDEVVESGTNQDMSLTDLILETPIIRIIMRDSANT